MSKKPLIERLKKHAEDFPGDKLVVEALKELKWLQEGRELELRYATSLARYLWEKHWKATAPNWKPLPDTIGVLTQLDNMVANLKKSQGAQDDRR